MSLSHFPTCPTCGTATRHSVIGEDKKGKYINFQCAGDKAVVSPVFKVPCKTVWSEEADKYDTHWA